ncbi:MAG: hypothetical protein CMJ58_13520 [Planctomycetaceae bacterium]|nr:hypothetical protein [Planctomycetaceae bacterium]
MGRTLGIMITATTYGTWLRGDRRGWVDEGRILPAAPPLEAYDRARMKHEPFTFRREDLLAVERAIAESLVTRKSAVILALHVGTWHMHAVVGATQHAIADIVKCAKDAARYALHPDRPIWTAGYDKRFCFDERALIARINYVNNHRPAHLRSMPQPHVTPLAEYLAARNL